MRHSCYCPTLCYPNHCYDYEYEQPPCCPPPISKLAHFCMGNGSLSQKSNSECRRPCPSELKAGRNINCCAGRLKKNAPPVFIGNDRCITRKVAPEDRVSHVDVCEEYCYYPKDKNCPTPEAGCCDHFGLCNCCGGVCVPELAAPAHDSVEPVRYTKRQRFSFNNAGDGRSLNNRCGSDDADNIYLVNTIGGNCGRYNRKNYNQCCCRGVNSFDEIPVGKNPVAKLKPCCCGSQDKETVEEKCGKNLPKASGVYRFSKRQGKFEKYDEEIVHVIEPAPVEEDFAPQQVVIRREPEILIQPIIQPPCNGNSKCCCQQPCCWNPMMGMGGLFGLNNNCNSSCFTGNVIPMCIPYGGSINNATGTSAPPPMPPGHPSMLMQYRNDKRKEKKKSLRPRPKEDDKYEDEIVVSSRVTVDDSEVIESTSRLVASPTRTVLSALPTRTKTTKTVNLSARTSKSLNTSGSGGGGSHDSARSGQLSPSDSED